jgi:hypothetical protein
MLLELTSAITMFIIVVYISDKIEIKDKINRYEEKNN